MIQNKGTKISICFFRDWNKENLKRVGRNHRNWKELVCQRTYLRAVRPKHTSKDAPHVWVDITLPGNVHFRKHVPVYSIHVVSQFKGNEDIETLEFKRSLLLLINPDLVEKEPTPFLGPVLSPGQSSMPTAAEYLPNWGYGIYHRLFQEQPEVWQKGTVEIKKVWEALSSTYLPKTSSVSEKTDSFETFWQSCSFPAKIAWLDTARWLDILPYDRALGDVFLRKTGAKRAGFLKTTTPAFEEFSSSKPSPMRDAQFFSLALLKSEVAKPSVLEEVSWKEKGNGFSNRKKKPGFLPNGDLALKRMSARGDEVACTTRAYKNFSYNFYRRNQNPNKLSFPTDVGMWLRPQKMLEIALDQKFQYDHKSRLKNSYETSYEAYLRLPIFTRNYMQQWKKTIARSFLAEKKPRTKISEKTYQARVQHKDVLHRSQQVIPSIFWSQPWAMPETFGYAPTWWQTETAQKRRIALQGKNRCLLLPEKSKERKTSFRQKEKNLSFTYCISSQQPFSFGETHYGFLPYQQIQLQNEPTLTVSDLHAKSNQSIPYAFQNVGTPIKDPIWPFFRTIEPIFLASKKYEHNLAKFPYMVASLFFSLKKHPSGCFSLKEVKGKNGYKKETQYQSSWSWPWNHGFCLWSDVPTTTKVYRWVSPNSKQKYENPTPYVFGKGTYFQTPFPNKKELPRWQMPQNAYTGMRRLTGWNPYWL
uniref:Uncharacterized protein n=1 Tax=Hemiarma marina TaxID=1848298 RepID=A0A679EJS8_9CRYP|nr:hypothetical protein [Hemiarma marina]